MATVTATLALRFVLFLPEKSVEDYGRRRITRPPQFLALRFPVGGHLAGYLTTKREEALVMIGSTTPPNILQALVPRRSRHRSKFIAQVILPGGENA